MESSDRIFNELLLTINYIILGMLIEFFISSSFMSKARSFYLLDNVLVYLVFELGNISTLSFYSRSETANSLNANNSDHKS